MSLKSLTRRLGAIAFAAFAMLAAASAHAFCINCPPPVYTATVKEYANDITGHYVLLSDPAEIAGVEQGSAGPGWRFTGYQFVAYQLTENTAAAAATAVPVCRFYAPAPTNSHFYTANAAECDFLKTHDTGWIFEKVDFKVNIPGANGSCAANLTPIWREYNNRFAQNDSNHRYGSDERVRAKMKAAGWIDEGTAFCASGADRELQQWFWLAGTGAAPSGDCGAQTSSDGKPCVALRNLPAMGARLDKWIAPEYRYITPGYTEDFKHVTDWLPWTETVYAPLLTADHAADAKRSFVQDVGSGPIGIHLNGADRLSGDYASIDPYFPVTFQPSTLQPNNHVFPWSAPHADRDMWIGFQLAVYTVRRSDDASHAYGGPLLDFRDATSGHHLWLTLQAFGTNAPADFAARDVLTGTAIVSTVFRADPLFGTRVAGDYLACRTSTSDGWCFGGLDFNFRIGGDDFAKVLQLARNVDPSLSGDIGRYELYAFQFHTEAYRNAEVGLVVDQPHVQLSY